MRNKFGATCSKCGGFVEAGTGETNKVFGKWRTTHLNGCPSRPVVRSKVGDWNEEREYSELGDYTEADFASILNPDEGDK